MKILTDARTKNFGCFNDDDIDDRRYSPDEREFITTKRILTALYRLIADENAPHEFPSMCSLFRTLKARGMKSSHKSLESRAKLKHQSFDQASKFNVEIADIVSKMLPKGFLDLGWREQIAFAAKRHMRSISDANKETIINALNNLPTGLKANATTLAEMIHGFAPDLKVSLIRRKLIKDKTLRNLAKPYLIDEYHNMTPKEKQDIARSASNAKIRAKYHQKVAEAAKSLPQNVKTNVLALAKMLHDIDNGLIVSTMQSKLMKSSHCYDPELCNILGKHLIGWSEGEWSVYKTVMKDIGEQAREQYRKKVAKATESLPDDFKSGLSKLAVRLADQDNTIKVKTFLRKLNPRNDQYDQALRAMIERYISRAR
jgi:YesN/AraC family two-component response regulator